MLDFQEGREVAAPRDAATILVVRGGESGIELFCVKRHDKSGFMGGAVVFPGGKVDVSDRDEAWRGRATEARPFEPGEPAEIARAFGVAACREALEEAAILFTAGATLGHDEVLALRAAVAKEGASLREAATSKGLTLDLAALHPFGRWITPEAETRRFDTRFFLACAPAGQVGAHDAHETVASFWGAPREVLQRFDAGDLWLAPPTHRCLELLADVATPDEAVELAATLGVAPICPKLVQVGAGAEQTMALVLPGDPLHEAPERRVPGGTRFVLRGERWLPEAPPP